ncbi:GIY-YIG nuclease family protein [Patescibacteria group bacterium]|nr:GIY-YIG nuclease family protein [Patescibacteria group bacterium]
MPYYTYVLYSDFAQKYYVGSTQDFKKRLSYHNTGKSKFTKIGIPWKLIKTFAFNTRTGAIKLEHKIKKRGIKRFIESI